MENHLLKYYFLGAISCLLIAPSCQENISESFNESNPSLETKSMNDIDGGSLPEVVVCANFIDKEDGGGSGGIGGIGGFWGDSGGGDYYGWWTPDFGMGGGGGGGGSSSHAPVTVKLVESLIKLFPKNSNLSKADLEKLNSEYKRMLVHCEYKSINDYLLKHYNLKGSIKMGSATSRGLVSFASNGDLKFAGSDAIDATNLAHEWIHMCQEALKPGCVKDTSFEGALEFELAVLQDVFHYKQYSSIDRLQPGAEFPETGSWVYNLDISNSNLLIFYKPFIKELCNNADDVISGCNFPFLYKSFADDFYKHNRNYQNKNLFFNSSYGYSNLKSIINLISDCYK